MEVFYPWSYLAWYFWIPIMITIYLLIGLVSIWTEEGKRLKPELELEEEVLEEELVLVLPYDPLAERYCLLCRQLLKAPSLKLLCADCRVAV